jgi:hypothetical protein
MASTTTGSRTHVGSLTPYDVLGIFPDASAAEVRSAYRRLVKVLHPDHRPGARERDHLAEARFRQVQQAYELLSDPIRRRDLDEELVQRTSLHSDHVAFTDDRVGDHQGAEDDHRQPTASLGRLGTAHLVFATYAALDLLGHRLGSWSLPGGPIALYICIMGPVVLLRRAARRFHRRSRPVFLWDDQVLAEADWYEDPFGRWRWRWWDGCQWTDLVSN